MKLAIFMLLYENGTIPNYFEYEKDYLNEWLDHHRTIGAFSLIIYTNDPSKLETFINNMDRVILHKWDNPPRKMEALTNCLITYRYHDYIALLDNDEFLYSPSGRDINKDLETWSSYDVIKIPWAVFGPNGHYTRPKGTLFENYINYREDKNCKLIIRPGKGVIPITPHLIPEEINFLKVKHGKHQINHYRTKSRKECLMKCTLRGFDRHEDTWPKTKAFYKDYVQKADQGPYKCMKPATERYY